MQPKRKFKSLSVLLIGTVVVALLIILIPGLIYSTYLLVIPLALYLADTIKKDASAQGNGQNNSASPGIISRLLAVAGLVLSFTGFFTFSFTLGKICLVAGLALVFWFLILPSVRPR